MSANANNIILYADYAKTLFSQLTNEEIGNIIKAIMKYASTGERTEYDDRLLRVVFERMAADHDNDKGKYLRRCRTNAKSAHRRWAVEKEAIND